MIAMYYVHTCVKIVIFMSIFARDENFKNYIQTYYSRNEIALENWNHHHIHFSHAVNLLVLGIYQISSIKKHIGMLLVITENSIGAEGMECN